MRIAITNSAREHAITDDEIRSVIEYPRASTPIAARKPGSLPVLFVGSPNNEPDMEIIADLAEPTEWIVFHAMMLRPTTMVNSGLIAHYTPTYARQRK